MLKTRKLIIPCMLILCAFSVPVWIAQSRAAGGKAEKVEGLSTEVTVSSTLSIQYRAYDEKIAVFIEDSTEPAEILDVYLFSLPPADAEILQDGITVFGDENLARVIEDYTS
jgi:hypothetical protein